MVLSDGVWVYVCVCVCADGLRILFVSDIPQWTQCVFSQCRCSFVRHELGGFSKGSEATLLTSHGDQTQSPAKSTETERVTITKHSHSNLSLTLPTPCLPVCVFMRYPSKQGLSQHHPYSEWFFCLWLYNWDKLWTRKPIVFHMLMFYVMCVSVKSLVSPWYVREQESRRGSRVCDTSPLLCSAPLLTNRLMTKEC